MHLSKIVLGFALLAPNQKFHAFACDGHGEDAAVDSRHLQDLKAMDEVPCGSIQASKKEKREAGNALQAWRMNRNAGRRQRWWKGNGGNSGKNRNLQQTRYLIPVTFHVLRRSNGLGDVSNDKLDQYVQYLNDEFTGSPFSFYKKATTRTNSDALHYCDFNSFFQAGQQLRQGGVADMNVYFCSITTGAGGWAYFPYG